jgi:hypothetical protein
MAIIRGKGSVYEIEVSTVLTAIAQLISIDLPEHSSETFEADTLDNSSVGIPHKPTGRVEGGSANVEGFLDPVLSSFQIITDRLIGSGVTGPEGHAITFADSGTTTWAYETAGTTLGGNIVLNDGVKFTASFKLDGSITFPS